MIDQADKAGNKPSVPYSHLYVDAHGVSHQSQCALTDYELKAVAPAAPQWNDKMDRSEATVVFTVQPVGWVGDWHENPAPQWIIVLSGRWWIESMDRGREDSQSVQRAHRTGAGNDWRPALLPDDRSTSRRSKTSAMSPDVMFPAIAGFRLVTNDPARLAAFYRAIGFDVGEAAPIPSRR